MADDGPPPRICQVVSQYHPQASGAERQALLQGAELVQRGHIVHVMTQSIPGQPRDQTVQGVHIHRWVDVIRVGPLFGVTFVLGMIRSLRKLRPEYDLIHTHQGLWEAIATGAGRGFLSGAPTIVQPASSGYFGEAEELVRTKGHELLRRAILRNSRLVAISTEIAEQWKRLGWEDSRVFPLASGVDADHFHPGPSLVERQLPSRPRVVFTGRIHRQKNLDLLLDAWPVVAKATGASLVLVGGGPERERLEARCHALQVSDSVIFTGPVDDPAEYLRGADLFVLPSVAEGMSNSLLEAMATGLACVASNIGGNIDLLSAGTGRLVDPDPTYWSESLIALLTDDGERRSLGQAARRLIEHKYALPVIMDRYVELYRSLLATSH